MKRLAIAVLLLAAGCGASDLPNWPDVDTLYRVNGNQVECDGPGSQVFEPADPPFTRIECEWERVIYQGEPRCYARVSFFRDLPEDPWSVRVFTTSASCY